MTWDRHRRHTHVRADEGRPSGYDRPIYRYAFLAYYGRVDAEDAARYLGETEAYSPAHASNRVRLLMRDVAGRVPRRIHLSRGQFSRMRGPANTPAGFAVSEPSS